MEMPWSHTWKVRDNDKSGTNAGGWWIQMVPDILTATAVICMLKYTAPKKVFHGLSEVPTVLPLFLNKGKIRLDVAAMVPKWVVISPNMKKMIKRWSNELARMQQPPLNEDFSSQRICSSNHLGTTAVRKNALETCFRLRFPKLLFINFHPCPPSLPVPFHFSLKLQHCLDCPSPHSAVKTATGQH